MSSLEVVATNKAGTRKEVNKEDRMKDYTLNITKALYKKLEATKRNLNVEYKYTNGGIVLTADAVTFELLRLATLNYFEKLPEIIGQANIRKITDKSQATVVQYIIKVIVNNASYTINIYNTTSRLLVNGNGANHFIDKDIPSIHKIMLKGLQEQGVKGLSIDELNRQLGNQLQNLLDNGNDMSTENKRNEQPSTEDSKETCIKCHKKCRTRSIFCDIGNHWVHYKCQKLTEQEIHIAENSSENEYYKCKLCSKVKSNLALERGTQSHTHAQQLLEEETEVLKVCNKEGNEVQTIRQPEQNCAVCDARLIDQDWDICEECNNNCHIKCMIEVDEAYICIACTIIQEELKSQENASKNLVTKTPCRDDEKSPEKAAPKLVPTTTKPPTNTKPIPKPRTLKTKQQSLDDSMKPKLSELRAREIKVNKVEEQLKVKEKSLLEIRNEKILLETRCQQLEARNFELEQTVKLLKRRMESDNHLTAPPMRNTCQTTTDSQDIYYNIKQELDRKLANLHTKLSNIVPDEMDKQIDKIKLFDDSPQPSTETPKTSRSRQTEKPLNDNQKENIAQIAQSKAQNLTGQPLTYKKAANMQVPKQQELSYNPPRYTGGGKSTDYPAEQRQQMWTNTRSDSIPQHNRGQYGNRNIMQIPTQQPFLAMRSLNLNRM